MAAANHYIGRLNPTDRGLLLGQLARVAVGKKPFSASFAIPPVCQVNDLVGKEGRNFRIIETLCQVTLIICNDLATSECMPGLIGGDTEEGVRKARDYIEWMVRFAQRGKVKGPEERIYTALKFAITLGEGTHLPDPEYLESCTLGVIYDC